MLKINIVLKSVSPSPLGGSKEEFEDGNYRTPELNPSIKYIYQEMNKLELEKRKKGDKISNVSRFVLKAGLEPARTLLFIGF